MSKKLDNNYYPLQMARGQQKHINTLKVTYPSDEKMLQGILELCYVDDDYYENDTVVHQV